MNIGENFANWRNSIQSVQARTPESLPPFAEAVRADGPWFWLLY
jgi:hypothetical protein